MPTDACQWFMSATPRRGRYPRWDYKCEKCQVPLKPKHDDCRMFCSYGDIPCAPIQQC
ncbi:MAG: GDCCVxC domain-containing (seleno)protein [Pseudomonadota bacterium]